MNIKIRFVEKCKRGVYGTTEIVDKNNLLILISRKKNNIKQEFFVTMLHELLHAWMFILKSNGIKMKAADEHKWIYLVQNEVVKALNEVFKKD